MNRYYNRGYNDFKKGITKCPYVNEVFQSYWLEGMKEADEESQYLPEPQEPILMYVSDEDLHFQQYYGIR